ncbi:hypothetical protein KDAU_70180 [Dictyobacter aurantiacus]|uniref:Uncharacterized protein n=1 Tax=Dictyobacter aurantiacus TaxID=1936993 RepID=A0A401ZS22_9CHLR|nr:hypothetical protein KDAU_70180 [Dictyobacter aurantiacus]
MGRMCANNNLEVKKATSNNKDYIWRTKQCYTFIKQLQTMPCLLAPTVWIPVAPSLSRKKEDHDE